MFARKPLPHPTIIRYTPPEGRSTFSKVVSAFVIMPLLMILLAAIVFVMYAWFLSIYGMPFLKAASYSTPLIQWFIEGSWL